MPASVCGEVYLDWLAFEATSEDVPRPQFLWQSRRGCAQGEAGCAPSIRRKQDREHFDESRRPTTFVHAPEVGRRRIRSWIAWSLLGRSAGKCVLSAAARKEQKSHENGATQRVMRPLHDVTGSVKVKVLPLPGTESTQIRPPSASTISLQIASPSPLPPSALPLST